MRNPVLAQNEFEKMIGTDYMLQLFADEPAGSGEGGAGGDSGEGAANQKTGTGGDSGEGAANQKTGTDGEKSKAKYSDDDLDKIIARKLSEERKKQQKVVDEAKRLAAMSQDEKVAEELKKAQEELKELQRQNAIDKMAKVARGILSEKSINLPDDLLSTLVTEDADTTKSNVNQFAKLFEKAVNEAVKEKMKGTTPKTGSAASGLSKEDIAKIKDRKARQQAIKDNINLYIGGTN
jgi:hypothetical protein